MAHDTHTQRLYKHARSFAHTGRSIRSLLRTCSCRPVNPRPPCGPRGSAKGNHSFCALFENFQRPSRIAMPAKHTSEWSGTLPSHSLRNVFGQHPIYSGCRFFIGISYANSRGVSSPKAKTQAGGRRLRRYERQASGRYVLAASTLARPWWALPPLPSPLFNSNHRAAIQAIQHTRGHTHTPTQPQTRSLGHSIQQQ